jgi:hypothetical protein
LGVGLGVGEAGVGGGGTGVGLGTGVGAPHLHSLPEVEAGGEVGIFPSGQGLVRLHNRHATACCAGWYLPDGHLVHAVPS